MKIRPGTDTEALVTVIDGKLTRNPSGNMSGIVNDYGGTPGRSKAVVMKAEDGSAPDVGSVVEVAGDRLRVMSVRSDQAGISHVIDLGDEFG
jgi:hypothetical protein